MVATSVPGAVGDGWFSAPTDQPVQVTCRVSGAPDLAISDWNFGRGNLLFEHQGESP